MWESGGDSPFTACDENNYQGWATSACTQRDDGSLYHSLTGSQHACSVVASMTMTAETHASWTPGPLTCGPGTVTENCCWWGRGAIQTTCVIAFRAALGSLVIISCCTGCSGVAPAHTRKHTHTLSLSLSLSLSLFFSF